MLGIKRLNLAVPVCCVLAAACSKPADVDCLSGLAEERRARDVEYLSSDYPLTDEQKPGFTGLEYFPGDATYCMPADFVRVGESETFDMPTFNESSIPFRHYGTFRFDLDGRSESLEAYQRMDLPEDKRQWVLVPFRDGTNGTETYGGGRYLEIPLPIDPSTVIDFNRASNPWCAYDAKYVCPVPPQQNWLPARVPAGELAFKVK